jgi:LCP family protein required for cell wall assembly
MFMKILAKLKINYIILFATAFLVAASIYLSWRSPISRAIKNGGRINALIIGTDWVDYARHSDTLIFISYDPVRRFLDIISIPRDTKYNPDGYNFKRINEVYAFHYRTKKNDKLACGETCNAVEDVLYNGIKISHYAQINYSGFQDLIDLIGGLEIEVDEPMHYDDNAGNLHIHFDPGRHHIDGAKALEYVRYRGQAGDVGRIFRQQRFIKSLLSSWKNPYFLINLPKIVKLLITEVHTNLSTWDMLTAIMELMDLEIKDLRLAQLPGKPKRGYWIPDKQNIIGLLEKIFPSKNAGIFKGTRVRVEVWNAAGVNKLAEKVVWILRKHGYDVIDWGNFSVRQKKTLIKDLTGDLQASQKISDILGCGEVITRYNEKRLIDISVILGEDCKLNNGHTK